MKTRLFRTMVFLGMAALAPAGTWGAETSGVSSQSISLPSGPGSIEGLGESFEPQLNTGTATYGVSFDSPPGRVGLQPSLGLVYNGGSGNGPVGMGWSITGLDFIQRQTDKGIPAYDPSDIFVTAAGEELVPLEDGSFRAENESSFKRYFFDATNNLWRGELPNGGELTFGLVLDARVEDAGRTYRWMLSRQEDALGNRIDYEYTSFPGSVNQVYLSRVYYTRHATQSLNGEHVVVLTYTGGRPDPVSDYRPSYELTTTHRLTRVDMCTRGGTFTPESLCDDVGEAGAARVRSYRIRYDEVGACQSLSCTRGLVGAFCSSDDQCVSGATRLAGVFQVGADDVSALPELSFTYTDYDFSTTAAWSPVFGFPATELAGAESSLADLDADGLPDVVQTPAAEPGIYKRWMNLGPSPAGAVSFASEQSFTGPTSQRIGNPGTQLVDLDGDGVADLLTRPDPTGDMFELFRGTGKGFFELTAEPFQILGVDGFTNSAEGFGNSAVRFVDVDFDKRIDVVRTVALGASADDLLVRQTTDFATGRGMLPTRSCGAVPNALFQDGKTFLEDLNGDRLLDIVVVEIAGGGDAVETIRYFPNLGTGGFGRLGSCGQQGLPIVVGGDPVAGLPGADFVSFRRFFWHDLTNDGLGDLVYLGPDNVSVWVNRGGAGLFRVDLGAYPSGAQLTLCDPGPSCDPDTVQFTDMNGNSTTDVLFVDRETGAVVYLDLAGPSGVPAHLLETIDNGLGRHTTIGYEPSTTDYLAAAAAATPWKSRLPFPVTVVASRSIRFGLDLDGVPGEDVYEADYRYRDGFYDGVEKEFRGFSEVEAIARGDAAQPTLVTRHSFHTGAPDGVDNDGDGLIDERTVRGGAEEEPLKGVGLEVRTETCSNGPDGDCAVTGEAFSHDFNRWEVRTLHGATGKACSGDPIVACCSDAQCATAGIGTCEQQAPAEVGSRPEVACEVGKSVHWAVTTGQRKAILERGSGPRVDTLTESDFDDFGNTTLQRLWGIVDAPDLPSFGCLLTSGVCSNDAFIVCGSDAECGAGTCLKASHADQADCTSADPFAFSNSLSLADERFETTQYIPDEANWQLRCASETFVTDVDGLEESRARVLYDGLPFGQCSAGLVTRNDGWLEEEQRWVAQSAVDYDVYGNVIEARDALGNRRNFATDANFATFPVLETIPLDGYTLSQMAGHHEGFGRTRFATQFAVGGPGARSDAEYDTHGRIVKRILPGDTAQAPTTEYAYHLNPLDDGVSFVDTHVRETTGGGTVDARTYVDAMGRNLATLSEGDAGDWIVTGLTGFGLAGTERASWLAFATPDLTLPTLDAGLPHFEILRDATGRELQTLLPGGDSTAMAYRPLAIDAFDENDTAGLTPGAFTTTTTDGLERLVRVIEREDSTPHTTRYVYDGIGNLVERSDALLNTTRIVYDHLGRRLRYEDPDRGTLGFTYDDADRVVEIMDARGARVLRSYDAADRLATETQLLPGETGGGLPTLTWHYDLPAPGPVDWGDGRSGAQTELGGRLSWVEDPTGAEYRSYDERGRIVWHTKRVRSLASGSSAAYTLHHQYDAMNRLNDIEYPDGDRLHFEHGPRGLIERIVGGTGSGLVLVDSVAFQANGDLREIVYGSGVREMLDQDERERRTQLQVMDSGGLALLDRGIEYDPSSNPTALLDLRSDFAPGTPRHNTRRMQYDDLHRLTSFRLSAPGDAAFNAGELTFSYDAVDNRLSRSSTIAGDPAFSAGAPVVHAFGGAAGRTGRVPRLPGDAPGPHALTSLGGETFAYDDNGNLTSYGGVQATWDAVDRLTRLASPSYESDYAYDYSGRRVAKRVRWLAETAERRAGEESESLYSHGEFEIRDGAPVKVISMGDRRLAEVTGTLDPSADRVQRLELRPGWNLVSVAVDASDAASQLGLGSGPGERAAWLWDPVRREYGAVEAGTALPPASVVWIEAAQAEQLALRGSFAPPVAPTLAAGGDFTPIASLAALPVSALPASSAVFAFDAAGQDWKLRSPVGALPLSELPTRLPPGVALYTSQHVTGVGIAPPETARVRFFHTDLTDSVAAVSDGAGQLVEETLYLPFGSIRVRSIGNDAGLARTPYDYVSKERDEESGLSLIDARYLDTARGRFQSVDSAVLDLGATPEPRRLNAYAYGLNNPFRFIDPDGREAAFAPIVRQINTVEQRQAANRAHWVAKTDAINKQIRAETTRIRAQKRIERATQKVLNTLYTKRQLARIERAGDRAERARAVYEQKKNSFNDIRAASITVQADLDIKLDEAQEVAAQAARAATDYVEFATGTENATELGARRVAVERFRLAIGTRNEALALGYVADAIKPVANALTERAGVAYVDGRLAQDARNDANAEAGRLVIQPLVTASDQLGGSASSSGAGNQ